MLKSIRNKILMAILVVTLMTTAAVTMVFYDTAAHMIESNYCRNIYSRVCQSMEVLDKDLENIYYIAMKAAQDKQIINLLQEYQEKKEEHNLEELALLLKEYGDRDTMISSLYLVLPEERLVVTSEEYPMYRKNLVEDMTPYGQWSDTYMTPILYPDFVHEGKYLLGYVRRIPEIDGYLFANVEEQMLYYAYLDDLDSEQEVSQVVLADTNNQIVAQKNFRTMGQMLEQEGLMQLKAEGIQSDKKSNIWLYAGGNFSGLGIFMTISRNDVLWDLKQMQYFLLMILLVFFIVAVILAMILAKNICRPVQVLTSAMEAVGNGDMEVRVQTTSQDEIGVLSRQFNRMLDEINGLFQKLLEEENLKKDAELEALQYQITPHFMYNTLNSIKFAALIKGDKEIGGLIGDFVELLQASIHKKGVFLTVSDELHILEHYLNLQRFRYEESFLVEYQIEPEAAGCYIPRLLLQPLVENSLLHGIDIKKEQGHIVICAWVEEEQLYLSVQDNGRGMSRNQIHELLTSKAKKTSGLSAVGIPNIRERLRLYYGEHGNMKYESSEQGTTVTVTLPVQKNRGVDINV